MSNQEREPGAGPPPLRLGRSLRFGIRAAWDALGLVCAASLSVFLFLPIPAYLSFKLGRPGVAAALASAALVLGPLYAGVCLLAHRVYAHDEPSFLHLWEGLRRFYCRAASLCVIQMLVTAVLAANILFYAPQRGFGFLLLSALFLYLLLFWGMCCQYHYPLLIAAEEGMLPRDGDGPARIGPVVRNGLVLAFSSPGFSFGLLVFQVVFLTLAAVSSVGAALLGAAVPAFVTTRALRDQLVRLGLLDPTVDPDEPILEDVWKVRE